MMKQTSDHCLLVLDNDPSSSRIKKRFYFAKRLLDIPEFESVMEKAWNSNQQGTPMFQVCGRIRNCRIELLKLKSLYHLNSGLAIREIKGKMESM